MFNQEFVPLGTYLDILNTIANWRIVNFNSIFSHLNEELGEYALRKKLRRLEIQGFLKTSSLGQHTKHYYLTRLGLKFSNTKQTEPIRNSLMIHDMTTGAVIQGLSKQSGFYDGRVFCESVECEVDPDCMIRGSKFGANYHLAVEVELTQKSSKRFKDKIQRYSKSDEYQYVLYISNKDFLLKAYRRFLLEMEDHIQNKIILMRSESLGPNRFDVEDTDLFYKGSFRSFKEVFGNEDRPKTGRPAQGQNFPAGNRQSSSAPTPSTIDSPPPTTCDGWSL